MSFFEESQDSERLIAALLEKLTTFLFIPAFTGLGAPQWNPDIRASFYGITRDTSKKDFSNSSI